jgi:hypothetical protein
MFDQSIVVDWEVVRHYDDETVCTSACRRLGAFDGLAGPFRADAGQYGNLPADLVDDRLDDAVALLGGQQRELAVGPQREHAVDTAVDDEPGVGGGRRQVDRLVFLERGDRRRDDAVETQRVVRSRPVVAHRSALAEDPRCGFPAVRPAAYGVVGPSIASDRLRASPTNLLVASPLHGVVGDLQSSVERVDGFVDVVLADRQRRGDDQRVDHVGAITSSQISKAA